MISEPIHTASALSVPARLADLRAQSHEIETVVYLDVNARTVLGVSSRIGKPQEVLDSLCRTASSFLSGSIGAGRRAVLMTRNGLLVMERLDGDAGAALCFFYAPEIDLQRAMEISRRASERVDL